MTSWALVISDLYTCGFYVLQVLYSKHKNLQSKINIKIHNHNKNSVTHPGYLGAYRTLTLRGTWDSRLLGL